MLKKISTVLVFVALFVTAGRAQWTFDGAWPDTNYKGGTHGIEVTPDGKVWTASYYKTPWITPNGDTLQVTPILVFSSDGSSVDTIYTVTTGTNIDTLGYNPASASSGTRSLAKDGDGNIYWSHSGPNQLVKINYQTHDGMARHDIGATEVGSSPIVGGISSDGTVFVGPVVGGGTTAIAMYNSSDLSYTGSALTGPPDIARNFEVADDGLTIYWSAFTGRMGVTIYTRPTTFDTFSVADTVLGRMSIESCRLNPATGLLWVSNDIRGGGYNKEYTHLTWYGYDLTTKTVVDSFTLPRPNPEGVDPTTVDEYPRGLAFSSDGNTAYVGLFGNAYNRIYKFTKGGVGVKKENDAVIDNYSLSQNYPNPFNPSTEIKFTVAEPGFVSLKVFDMLGREVATLVSENLTTGGYSATFDAANLSSGTYIYQLNVNGTRISKKMTLIK